MNLAWLGMLLALVFLFGVAFVRDCLRYGRDSEIVKSQRSWYLDDDQEFEARLGPILKFQPKYRPISRR